MGGLLYILARSGQCGVRHKGHGAFKWPKAFVSWEDGVQGGLISFAYLVSSGAPFWFVLDLYLLSI